MNEGSDLGVAGATLVAELALRLHQARGIGLRIDVPAGSLLTAVDLPNGCRLVNETALEFGSLLARNIVVARVVFEDLQSSRNIEPDALFERAYELWREEIGHEDQASGRLLALASERMDIFSIGAQRIRSGSDVFEVLHLIEAALPHILTVQASSIIDLFVAKYEPTKNDLAGGVIHGALETWLESRPDYARELHARVLNILTEATASLAGNAIVALAKTDYAAAVDIAKSDVQADIPLLPQVGCWTLGRLLLVEHAPLESIDVVVQEIIDLIQRENGELRSQAIRAAVSAMHVLGVFDPVLYGLALDGDQDVLCAATTALFLKANELRARGITQRWLELMPVLRPDFKRALRDLDHAMAQLLSDPTNAPMVVSTLSHWVANHGEKVPNSSETAELFGDTVRKLSALQGPWSSLVTDWLLSDAAAHPAALAGMLTQLSPRPHEELMLDKLRLDDLSEDDLLFLARRLLGYVHDRSQLTSLVLSMLESTEVNRRIYPVLRALLVDEIGYDYPGSTEEVCRKAAEAATTGRHKEFLLQVAGAIAKMVEAQTTLPTRSELRPPTRLRRLFALARAKQMNESFEAASERSIFRQIATQITIKAGRGTFSFRDANYGPSMKLAPMSHSIELPRREAFDPIGNSIRHFGFRHAKRGES